MLEFDFCTIGSEKKCFSVKITWRIFWIVLLLIAVSTLASGLYGAAVSPFSGLGLSYAAYQFSLDMLILSMLIPGVGLIIGIGFFGIWTSQSQLNLGITADYWISSVTTAAFWIGIVLQVFLLIYIFWWLVTNKSKKTVMAS